MAKDVQIMTNCVIELHILSKVNSLPIVIYDDYTNPIYIFDKGLVYDHARDKTIPTVYVKYTKDDQKNVINLKFSFLANSKIPDEIETMYFKD